MTDYLDVNRANWDDRVPAHVTSADYAVRRFTSDPGFISGVVRFDVPLLGDVAGSRAVHLQVPYRDRHRVAGTTAFPGTRCPA